MTRNVVTAFFFLMVLVSAVGQGLPDAQTLRALKEARQTAERYPGNREAWENYGRLIHDAVLDKTGVVARDSVAVWERIYRVFPQPRNLAYLGSAWNLVARDSENVLEKIDGVTKALQKLDAAMAEDPQDLVIRWIRYENFIALPGMFQREAAAEADLDFLLGVYRVNPAAFDGLYDPAHIFLSKARLLRRRNVTGLSLGLARAALRIVKDPELRTEILEFIGE